MRFRLREADMPFWENICQNFPVAAPSVWVDTQGEYTILSLQGTYNCSIKSPVDVLYFK